MYRLYTLASSADPLVVRYVGKTEVERPKVRLNGHLTGARAGKTYRSARWIASELKKGNEILMHVFEQWGTPRPEREIYWIKKYRELGYPLTNSTDGGETDSGYRFSDESKLKMSETKIKNRAKNCKSIYRVDNDYNIIKKYNHAFQAAEDLSISSQSVHLCCNRRSKGIASVASDMIFVYDLNHRPLESMRERRLKTGSKCYKPVNVYGYLGNFIESYKSVKHCAQGLGITISSVGNGLNDFNRLIDYKYRFAFKSDDFKVDYESLYTAIGKACLKRYRSAQKQSAHLTQMRMDGRIKPICKESIEKANNTKRLNRLVQLKSKPVMIEDKGLYFADKKACADYIGGTIDQISACLTRFKKGSLDAVTAGCRVRPSSHDNAKVKENRGLLIKQIRNEFKRKVNA